MSSKKNVVFLVIDSLSNYNRRDVEESLMPFLNGLKRDSLYFPNMYSEAPYTEAAVMSMLCGKNTLEDEGYLYRFDKSKNIFECFQENGYEVYNYIQPHVHPSSILKGSNHYYYNVCYDFNVLWEYRLYFYSQLYKENKLSLNDYKKTYDLLDDNFEFWALFFETLLKGDKAFSLIKDNIERLYDKEYIEKQYQKVLIQKDSYTNNKEHFVNMLLEQGKKHDVFQIGILNQNIKVNESTKKWLIKNYKDVFDEIQKANKKKNFRFDKINWYGVYQDMLEAAGNHKYEKLKGNFAYFKNGIFDRDLMDRLYRSDAFKAAPSLYSHINHFEQLLVGRNKNTPFFSCIHVDDIHNPEIFFTYDTDDKELLKEEFDDVKNVLNKYKKEWTGSATYYLALKYIDRKIEYLFDVLERQGILRDTIVVITGDHGFSFDYVNIRNSCVNNHYLENYNVPLYIYDSGKNNFIDDRICSSKDIFPTLLEYLQLKQSDDRITGSSLFDEEKDYVVLQNVMGGCPDIEHRPVTIGILTKTELLVGEADLSSCFEDIRLEEYYDLKYDPHQRKNTVKQQKEIKNKYIYRILEKEFGSLYRNIEKI